MPKRLLLESLTVAWVAALLCVTQVLSAGNCDPDCHGKNPLDKVADPLNCTQYYMCLGENMPSDDTLPCPTGTSFDATATPPDCTGTVPCDPPCRLPPCDLTCDSNLDPISDPRSCNSYYICSEEIVIGPLECPSDKPFFDGEACGVDDTKCCGDVCIAYCYPGQIEAPDPYDCHKYYLCPKEGLVEEQNHFDCPAGSNFVVTESSCLEDAPCNTLCGVNTTTSSTTTTPFTTSYTTSTSHRIVIQPP